MERRLFLIAELFRSVLLLLALKVSSSRVADYYRASLEWTGNMYTLIR